jgi:hypothetical protein
MENFRVVIGELERVSGRKKYNGKCEQDKEENAFLALG